MTLPGIGIAPASAVACMSPSFAASASIPLSSRLASLDSLAAPMIRAKQGADDPAGDDRRGRGRGTDDGAGHA